VTLVAPWELIAVVAAALLGSAVGIFGAAWPRHPTVEQWLRHRTQRRSQGPADRRFSHRRGLASVEARLAGVVQLSLPSSLKAALSSLLTRAGISTSPETAVAIFLSLLAALTAVILALAIASVMPASVAVLVVLAAPLGVVARVIQMAGRRRRAIVDQLPILVDLMALEQGGGGVGARTAMEFVVSRLGGEAALLLRDCLTLSATSGTPQLDRQLEAAAVQLNIPALSALAAVVRIQREEGVSTTSPLGQLARGMRDRQRDELLSRGRRALVTMLLPVALCILLPFVIIILYPALQRLSAAFS
jgi:Flp pilus assembly protein TadB